MPEAASPRAATWILRPGPDGPRQLAGYRLTVVSGPDAGTSVQVRAARARVGSLEGNDLTLSDPWVSGVHLELTHEERGVRVKDLGSKNGVLTQGVQLLDGLLTQPTVLRLGNSEVAFQPEPTLFPVAQVPRVDRFGPLVGGSVAMRELYAQLQNFGPREATVLIEGETGSGKELVAEALVQASPRADRPLVVLDCSALAPTLAESQLFGHERGAYTGAQATAPGAFERASGGTVFLDEIGELPPELQPRLLRVLERREVQRLGGKAPLPVDVRILAATNRSLEEEVNAGRFRADLFYRLSVLRVVVPPLRERLEDVPLLVRHFGFEADERTLQRLQRSAWPGNVRELKNAVERLKAGVEPLAEGRPSSEGPPSAATASLDEPFLVQKERLVNAFEQAYARALLQASQGNLSEAARRAGVSRMAVVKMLTRLGLWP